MSTTFQIDTATSRATPTPQPMKRLTVPKLRARKKDGKTDEPIVMLTAYTARMAQLLDPHCDLLLVGGDPTADLNALWDVRDVYKAGRRVERPV